VKKQTRVFILGAGCSADYGYPLGVSLLTELRNFLQEVPADCPTVKKHVVETVSLLATRPNIQTLDQLAQRIDLDLDSWKKQRNSFMVDAEYLNKERAADKQILDAKIATSVMFEAKEEKARATGLAGYMRLIDLVLGGQPWQNAVAESDGYILTFNYDRLFEVAFQDYCNWPESNADCVYEKSVLNAGFDAREWDGFGFKSFQPVDGRFCFLKLHGAAGWWIQESKRGKLYWPGQPVKKFSFQDREGMLKKIENGQSKWEPLIAFPHERQRSASGKTKFTWDAYLRTAEKSAAQVLAKATEVRIIGYSFAPIDSRSVVGSFLSKIPQQAKVIVQNPDVETVKARLDAYPSLRGRCEFDPKKF